jgi:hypothetical protein
MDRAKYIAGNVNWLMCIGPPPIHTIINRIRDKPAAAAAMNPTARNAK